MRALRAILRLAFEAEEAMDGKRGFFIRNGIVLALAWAAIAGMVFGVLDAYGAGIIYETNPWPEEYRDSLFVWHQMEGDLAWLPVAAIPWAKAGELDTIPLDLPFDSLFALPGVHWLRAQLSGYWPLLYRIIPGEPAVFDTVWGWKRRQTYEFHSFERVPGDTVEVDIPETGVIVRMRVLGIERGE